MGESGRGPSDADHGVRAPVTTLAEGETVGAYVLERRIGGGTFADVWLGRHKVLRSRHAVKVLDPQWVAHPVMRERFLAEGRILAQLRHPALVQVTDVIDVAGPPGSADRVGLVMEYVDGGTLDGRLRAGQLPPALARDLVRDVLDGMQHAHDAGVIHRDLKPENILLVDRPGERTRAVIVDFGIAKVVAGADVDASISAATRAHTRMGTPRYMSPEQIESSHAVDRRSDVFAIGAILYELLLGRVAFAGQTATDVMYHVTRGHLTPAPELSDALRDVLLRALATDPDARFPDCRSFRAALDALPDAAWPQPASRPGTGTAAGTPSEPTLAPAGTLPVRPAVPVQRGGAPVAALLAVGLVLLVGVGGLAGLAALWLSGSGPVLAAPDVAPPVPVPVVAVTPPAVAPPPAVTPPPAAVPPPPAAVPPPSAVVVPPPTTAITPPTAQSQPAEVSPAPAPRPVEPLSARIDRAWSRLRGDVAACRPGKGVATTWKVTVAFDGSGRVTATSAAAQPKDDATARCLAEAARKLRVDAAGESGRRVFTVQFPKE